MPELTWSLVECCGLVSGLAYILCAYRKTNLSWPFGIISASCIIYHDITFTHLYFDAVLHTFFFLMSLIGVYLWKQGSQAKKEIRISKMPISSYLAYLLISILISGAAGFLLDTQTDAVYPYLDCFQMMLSMFATFLIIYCVINAWSYWILVDMISIGLYAMTGAYLFAILYIAYLISNGMKWRQWQQMYKEKKASRMILTPES